MEKAQNDQDLVKKFFDPKNYNTIVVKSENTDLGPTSLIDLLTNVSHRDIKNDILNRLKVENGLPLLVEAIKGTDDLSNKSKIIAACWESGINCSNQLEFFTDLALDSHLEISIEAITVIETMEGPFIKNVLDRCIEKVEKGKLTALHSDLLSILKQFINLV